MKFSCKYRLLGLFINTLGGFMASCQSRHLSTAEKKSHMSKTIYTLKGQPEETIPRSIDQSATEQLIRSINSNDVLCVTVTPEHFKDIGLDFKPFPAILYSGKNGNHIFYLNQHKQDVYTALEAYSKQNLISVQPIGIEDPVDFFELATKTGPGAASKPKSNIEPDKNYATLDQFCKALDIPNGELKADHLWRSLSTDRIKKALEDIPKQIGSGECGANSGARALILCNVNENINTKGTLASFQNSDKPEMTLAYIGVKSVLRRMGEMAWQKEGYDCFLDECPLDGGKLANCVRKIGTGCSVVLDVASVISAGLVGSSTSGTVKKATDKIADKIETIGTGPSPWNLSKYINEHIPAGCEFTSSKVHTYEDFKDCTKDIAQAIKSSEPVFVFIMSEPTKWHYANVVAVKGLNEPEGFMLLDTDGSFEYRTYNNMKDIMCNEYKFYSSFCLGGTPKNYTIVRFHRG